MERSRETKRLWLLAAALIPLLILAAFAYHTLVQYRQSLHSTIQSQSIHTNLKEVLSLLVENEADVRGAIITGNTSYLQVSRESADLVRQRLAHLDALFNDYPQRQELLRQLKPLVAQWLGQIGEIAAEWSDRNRPAKALTELIHQRDREMGAIKSLIARMEAEELGIQQHWSELSWRLASRTSLLIDVGLVLAFVFAAMSNFFMFRDFQRRRQAERERVQAILQLREAMSKVKVLSGLLPICASCRKIRDDNGYWRQIEVYIRDHSEADFSHGLCPECAHRLYPELSAEIT